ncbi:hypothetical protein NP233_g11041 [Leucocoprinus birnbaumii]|uniref:Uncharacterized protein n=1 Tax=Leucocoprinus birnbaumii TaxID=56174 RepID=A0AAD5VJL8_9AGAR|nr:hypothetical protein NP233_g11041 [Leucocoprinus birnbaumii]
MDWTSTGSRPKTNNKAPEVVKDTAHRHKLLDRMLLADPVVEMQEENVQDPLIGGPPHRRGRAAPMVGVLPNNNGHSLWVKTSPHQIERVPGIKCLNNTLASDSLLNRLSEETSTQLEPCDRELITLREHAGDTESELDGSDGGRTLDRDEFGERDARNLSQLPFGEEGLRRVPEIIPSGVRNCGKVREDVLPWYGKGNGTGSRLTESMRKTQNLLEYFSRDLKAIKRWVSTAEGAPRHFPHSKWTNIVKGESVDLDNVLGCLFSVRWAKEETGNIGGVEFTFTKPEPAKSKKQKVETAQQWQSAWRLASEATRFAFPHRRDELDEYSSYILDKFARRQTSEHEQVIRFDAAVRDSVGGGANSSLTDREVLEPFWESILLPGGIEYRASTSTGRASGRKGNDSICN